MKRLFTILCTALILASSNAQNPRLVLVEEFTGETCGPCAATNPPFNALLDANHGKVVSIKYQNDIPSPGPNYFTYNSADVNTRQTYYGNTSSPDGILDGNVWHDHPADLTQAMLTNRAAVTSPFTVAVLHWFSTNHDSIYASVTVTATKDLPSTTNHKLRVVVAERNLYGYTSTNGESEYSHVMRKMLPNAGGTALPTSWVAGQTITTNVSWKIAVPTSPTIDMPIWAMLEVVGFVQNDGSKEVLQAGFSAAVLKEDVALTSISTKVIECSNELGATIVVENLEDTPVTSMDIELTIDNNPAIVEIWTSPSALTKGQEITIQMPNVALTPGVHAYNIKITKINGAPDLILSNSVSKIYVAQPFQTTTVAQAFAPNTWPPTNWFASDVENDKTGWSLHNTAGFGTGGAGCAKMDFYNSFLGNIDYLYYAGELDLTKGSLLDAKLSFDLAHKRYDATTVDKLDVEVSTNCGDTWASVWSKSGAALATNSTPSQSSYVPTLQSHWRKDSVDLKNYLAEKNLLIRFKATSGFGNNLYIDNVNTLLTSSTEDLVSGNTLNIYPNPTSSTITLDFTTKVSAEIGVSITNTLGQTVYSVQPSTLAVGAHKLQMQVGDLANGQYFVHLITKEGVLARSFVVAK